MSHDNWDDEKIEKLLSNVPKIHDHRSKDSVFQRLKEDGLFDEEPNASIVNKVNNNKKKIYWLPMGITAVALFMMVLFLPTLIKSMNSNSNLAFEKSTELKDTSTEEATSSGKMEMLNEDEVMTESGLDLTDLRSAAYPEDLNGNYLFKLGMASDDADSIPITVLIPEETIKEIFTKQVPTGIELYHHFAPLVNEEEIGFVDYHPLVGNMMEKDDYIHHILPNDQSYDLGSASLSTYISVLIDTFSHLYEGVAILNEEEEGFTFSDVGEPMEPLEFTDKLTQYNYFKYIQHDGNEYLTPNFRTTYPSVEEALYNLSDETNDIYKSVLLPNVSYNVTVEEDIVIVTFEEPLDLFAYDQQDAMQMIEGMLLTAGSFDMSIRFQQILQDEWQGFNFSQVLPKPIGANKIPFDQIFHQN